MYCKRAALASFILVICAACSRKPAAPVTPRIAVLRFENLSPHASGDWMGRAFSEIVTAGIASDPSLSVIRPLQMHALDRETGVRPVSAPGISSERALALLSGANELGYGDYSIHNGRLRVRLEIEDAVTNRSLRVLTAESDAGDVTGAANNLAHQVTARASAFGTSNSAAVHAYVNSIEAATPAEAGDAAARAIAADPNFGPAYRLLAGAKARANDIPGALEVLKQAADRGDAIPPADRARNALEAAGLRGDLPGRITALAELVKVDPDDTGSWRSLAELEYAEHRFSDAAAAYEKVLTAEPRNADSLNSQAYAYAYAGDLDKALADLRRYQTVRPNDANALDSTGDVYLITGHLAEAEKSYLDADRKDPNFHGAGTESGDLYKAAMAHLMTGDVPGSDALFKRYADARTSRHDPTVPIRQADWEWLSGRRLEACRDLAAFAQSAAGGPLKDLAARAYGELALWNLMMGNAAAADDVLHTGAPLAGPGSAATIVLMRFLELPGTPSELSNRLDQLFRNQPQVAAKQLWLLWGLLFNNHFDAAAAELKKLYDSGQYASDESIPILLAWALVSTGHVDEAAPLLRSNPVPPLGGTALLDTLYFPRLYDLRGVVAAKQGKQDEAKAEFQLFRKLSGQTPLRWGEEKRAQ